MIQCPKCEANNPSGRDVCEACGANLLPGESIRDRIGNLIVGILGGVMAGVGALLLIKYEVEIPECMIISPQACLFAAIASPIAGLVSALQKTPLYKRYATRARRHIEIDPEQAIADFSQALETAPEKEQAGLLKERAALYEKLGMEKEATRDQLDFTSAPGAYDGGIMRLFGDAAVEGYTAGAGDQDRKKLVAAGRAKALGYCSKCGGVVELNPDLRCPDHTSAKPKAVRVVLPDEVEVAIPEVLSEYTKDRRTKRNILIVLGIVIGIPLLCCIASTIMNSLAPSTPSATVTASKVATVASPRPKQRASSTPESTVPPPTSTIMTGSDFTDASVISRGWLDSGSLLVTLQVPNGVEGNYYAVVGGNEFKCEILEDHPDRLYCHGTGVKSLTQVDASWYLEGVEQPVYQTEITVP